MGLGALADFCEDLGFPLGVPFGVFAPGVLFGVFMIGVPFGVAGFCVINFFGTISCFLACTGVAVFDFLPPEKAS